MFPLSAVVFPEMPIPLHVFEPRYRQLVSDCLSGDREFGIVLIARGSEVGGNDERTSTGTLARIEEAAPFDDGRYGLGVRGLRRIKVTEWLADDPYPVAIVEEFPEHAREHSFEHLADAIAALRRTRALLSELRDAPPLHVDIDVPTDPGEMARLAWQLCAMAPVDAFDRQRLLEAPSVDDRMQLLRVLSDDLSEDITLMLAGRDDT